MCNVTWADFELREIILINNFEETSSIIYIYIQAIGVMWPNESVHRLKNDGGGLIETSPPINDRE